MAELTFDKCALIGYNLEPEQLEPVTGQTINYQTEYVGKVQMTISAYQALLAGDFERGTLAGICWHRTFEKKLPVLIDTNFINGGFKSLNPPMEFEEKCAALIRVLYQKYGKENHKFELRSDRQFAWAYADPDEFTRIIDQLKSDHYITYSKRHLMSRSGPYLFQSVQMTPKGKREAKKTLPQMPLVGLVSQTITTGNIEVDAKINQARDLFLSEPPSLENMRSACETLSYVLEPLRKDLSTYFATKDVSDFFQMVNTFDIRHNKESTKKITSQEQLEWVFYSLLNTINTYSKLKKKEE